MKSAKREELFQYVKKKYGTIPDYPFKDGFESAVFRHADSRKWYGLVMHVERKRLGLTGSGAVDILNVKCDTEMGVFLRQSPGILPGYHMNHEKWISILMDGTVEWTELLSLLDESYALTDWGGRRRKN